MMVAAMGAKGRHSSSMRTTVVRMSCQTEKGDEAARGSSLESDLNPAVALGVRERVQALLPRTVALQRPFSRHAQQPMAALRGCSP